MRVGRTESAVSFAFLPPAETLAVFVAAAMAVILASGVAVIALGVAVALG